MCGRYAVVTKVKVIEERFGVKATEEVKPTPNVGVGMKAPVITQQDPKLLQLFTFGLTPSWAKKPMYLFNARSEGDHNTTDDPRYHGAKGIIEKPAFRKAIRSQRCLVVADAFMEGPKDVGLDKPYLFYLRNGRRPFCFAGIWEEWIHPEKGTSLSSFAIITAPANALVAKIGHHRSPVILSEHEEKLWLDGSLPLADITSMLHAPVDEEMNAYPISSEIKNIKHQEFALLMPQGERLRPEYNIEIEREIELFGMGESRSGRLREKKNNGQLGFDF